MVEKVGIKKNINKIVLKKDYVEPFIIPAKIRIVASWKQKILKIFLILAYAAVVGMSISYLKDFVTNNGVLYIKKSILLFLSSSIVLGVIMVIFGGVFTQFISRSRVTISTNTFIKHLINMLFPLAVIIMMKMEVFGTDPEKFIKMYIYIMCGIGFFSWIVNLFISFIERKKFPLAVKTAILLSPGFIAVIASLFTITFKYEEMNSSTMEIKDFIVTGIMLASGIVFIVIGMAFAPQSYSFDTKLRRIIKYDFLYHMLFVFASVAIFLIASFDISIITKYFKGIVTMGFVGALSLGLIIYMLFFSKLKKIHNVNPMSNKIMLFSYMVFSMGVSIWSLYGVSDFTDSKVKETEYSYSTFAGVSGMITVALTISAFTSFITIEFNRFTILAATLLQTISFLSLIAVLYTQPSASLINIFMSSFVVTILSLLITFFLILGEISWILSLLFTKVNKTKIKVTEEVQINKKAIKVKKEKNV